MLAVIATGADSVHVCHVRTAPSEARGRVTRANMVPDSVYSEQTRSDVDVEMFFRNMMDVIVPATVAENFTPNSTRTSGASPVALNVPGTCMLNRVDCAHSVPLTSHASTVANNATNIVPFFFFQQKKGNFIAR